MILELNTGARGPRSIEAILLASRLLNAPPFPIYSIGRCWRKVEEAARPTVIARCSGDFQYGRQSSLQVRSLPVSVDPLEPGRRGRESVGARVTTALLICAEPTGIRSMPLSVAVGTTPTRPKTSSRAFSPHYSRKMVSPRLIAIKGDSVRSWSPHARTFWPIGLILSEHSSAAAVP